MREIATQRGGKCLSDKYRNIDTKLKWECKNGHIWEATPNNVKNNNSWCPKCAGAERKTLGIADIEPPFELKKGEDLTLRIFIDKNLVEVFANDRQAAAHLHDRISPNPNISIFTRDSELLVKGVRAWKMKSIWK